MFTTILGILLHFEFIILRLYLAAPRNGIYISRDIRGAALKSNINGGP